MRWLISLLVGLCVEKIEDVLKIWFLSGRLFNIWRWGFFSHHSALDVKTIAIIFLRIVILWLSLSILLSLIVIFLLLAIVSLIFLWFFFIFASKLSFDDSLVVIYLVLIQSLPSRIINLVYFLQFLLIDHLLLLGKSSPLNFSEEGDLGEAEIGIIPHHLFPLVGHKQQKGSLGTSPLLVIIDNIHERGVSLRVACHTLPHNIFQLYPPLALFDELALQICEFWVFGLPPTLILSAELDKSLQGVSDRVRKFADLHKKGLTMLRLSSMVQNG